jgi:hypothetical protein
MQKTMGKSRHFILDISFGRGVNDGGVKPFVSRVVPAEREQVGACNEKATDSSGISSSGILGT